MNEFTSPEAALLAEGATFIEAPRPASVENVSSTSDLPAPVLGVLRLHRRPPPPLDLATVFGPFWSRWIGDAADAAGAPPGYAAMALLAAASAATGHARHASPRPDWTEPPHLWCAVVGSPAAGKTPATMPAMRLLDLLSDDMAAGFDDDHRRWQTEKKRAELVREKWEREAVDAVGSGGEVPEMPPEAVPPPEPVRPRLRVSDTTTEKAAHLLAGLPRGFLIHRDELAGWVGGFDRYGGGGDRQFWLEAFQGNPYTVERVKHGGQALRVPRLSVALLGGMQPDRMAEVMADADDGLLPRFLWCWEERRRDAAPAGHGADHEAAYRALSRLAALAMAEDGRGAPAPVVLAFTGEARALHAAFEARCKDRSDEAHGLMSGALGKAPGHAARVALVLELLLWCATPGAAEPAAVSADALNAAVAFMEGYALPMAERCFADASAPQAERDAAAVARWIVRDRPAVVNRRELVKETPRPAGVPRDARRLEAACEHLVDAGWLLPAVPTGQRGRPRADYAVNPRLWPVLEEPSAPAALTKPGRYRQNGQYPEADAGPAPPDDVFGDFGNIGVPVEGTPAPPCSTDHERARWQNVWQRAVEKSEASGCLPVDAERDADRETISAFRAARPGTSEAEARAALSPLLGIRL